MFPTVTVPSFSVRPQNACEKVVHAASLFTQRVITKRFPSGRSSARCLLGTKYLRLQTLDLSKGLPRLFLTKGSFFGLTGIWTPKKMFLERKGFSALCFFRFFELIVYFLMISIRIKANLTFLNTLWEIRTQKLIFHTSRPHSFRTPL